MLLFKRMLTAAKHSLIRNVRAVKSTLERATRGEHSLRSRCPHASPCRKTPQQGHSTIRDNTKQEDPEQRSPVPAVCEDAQQLSLSMHLYSLR
mmetsp:Transcript_103686/g.199033  ORF Transcript_103686/g.199033 Transcript_103686/m.199033 type:complete len:93 (+) Transcript_103686:122-400(+)